MGSLNTWTEVIAEIGDIEEECGWLSGCHGNKDKEGASQRVNKIQRDSVSLSRLLNDAFSLDNRRQNAVLKLIEAINCIKSDLEIELMNSNEVDYLQIQTLIKQSRSIKQTTDAKHLVALETTINNTKAQLESYLHDNRFNSLGSNLENYKLVYNFVQTKFKANIAQNPGNAFPKYFVDMEIGGTLVGRVVIATRPDIAPKMCENFKLLMEMGSGVGYRGCTVFQCWRRESVITGDFEYNNGRGGYSIFNKNLFLPEDTKLISSRGAIGMRRTQKRHDSKGLVGSQFRIILQDMPGFTGIFGHVISGLNIIDKISEYGDSSGNPTIKISIQDCGGLY